MSKRLECSECLLGYLHLQAGQQLSHLLSLLSFSFFVFVLLEATTAMRSGVDVTYNGINVVSPPTYKSPKKQFRGEMSRSM